MKTIVVADYPPPDNQEAFNRVWERAKTRVRCDHPKEPNTCYYRYQGDCCFMGALIPDSLYEERIEGNATDMLLVISRQLREFFVAVDKELLVEMQGVHDAVSIRDWAVELCSIAERFDLEVPS